MHLYNLTLQRASIITHAINGNFSGTKNQEIILAKGKIIELLRPDPNTGKVFVILQTEVFGVIRSLMPFRLTGGSKDFIVVGSDSGRIVILEYNPTRNQFEKLHQETFGKSGCRRIVPGQYLAVDPKGRAVMIGAIEKQKLVYILNRDSQARLTISSPLEAFKSHTLVYHMVGMDVGYENPMFACIEMDFEEADTDTSGEAAQKALQHLTYYELDLGLNHVVRKYSEPLEEHANFLICVPGGQEGPSGLLVCSENYITYKHSGDQPDIRIPLPRRRNDLDDPDRSVMLVCAASHKTKTMFFFLVQTEQGDVFKLTLETDEDLVTEIRLKYFDTVPVAASMCVLRTGFLFVASEFGNHYLYQIAHLGDDDEPTFSSAIPLDQGDTFYFAPRPLRNLVMVDELDSLCPVMDCQVADLAREDSAQLFTLCGRGPRSSLRVLRHGLEISEMAVSDLPGSPNAVWTVKRFSDEEFDSYIVVSFVNATLVLSIGETVEEVTDSGFLGTTPTLQCGQLGADALVQVYPDGIRHIRADKRINEWRAPGKRIIARCAVNQRQVAIALAGGELVYFEMDAAGQLNEYTERKDMSADVVCMALGRVPPGEQRCRFLAVGLSDNTVRIVSLDPADCLAPLSLQALPAPPESLGGGDVGWSAGTHYLNIGLQNGVLLRALIDPVTGDLSDTRTRYLGSRPVKLFRVFVQGSEAVLAISSRSWLYYTYQSRFHLTPLSYGSLEFASGFSSEQCLEGIVAISASTLRILSLEKLGTVFNQVTFPLQYTPRRLLLHESGQAVLIETEHNAFTEDSKQQKKRQIAQEMLEQAGADGDRSGDAQLVREMAAAFLSENLPEPVFGAPKPGAGMWASVIRVMRPLTGQTAQIIRLQQNEAALSICLCRFACNPMESYLLVGIVKDMTLAPRSVGGAVLRTYRVVGALERLDFLHETAVEDAPQAMCPFQGRVLVSVGRVLRIYDLGKQKMLRKCETKALPNYIVSVAAFGDRVVAADVQESVFWMRYRASDNQLLVFADDSLPRWVTCLAMLDQFSVAVGDKFGNISVLRLPPDAVEDDADDVGDLGSARGSLFDRGGLLGSSSQKCVAECTFHVGEALSSLRKTSLVPGGNDCLLYTTISGSVGIALPLASKEEHDLFQHLELHLRSQHLSLLGRDHLQFRSMYFPNRRVIDGDLCEMFNNLEPARQKEIAQELDRTPSELSKKLEDIRTRFAF
uniref:Splicing factor 3B subunit 3 n=1 Tax=Macrostomum lignano TaxID=282301 RepID=A0A1I8G4E5_9PLAT